MDILQEVFPPIPYELYAYLILAACPAHRSLQG